jgi:hypothetical protein
MAACLPSVCSSSQVAAAETLAASIFSAYCTSNGFTDLAQVTAAPSTSLGTTTSTGYTSQTPSPCGSIFWVSLRRIRSCLLDCSR